MSLHTQVMSAQELFDYAKMQGIAEGLRMAAEMVGGIYKCEGVKKLILAKAKEVEERKIESKTKVL